MNGYDQSMLNAASQSFGMMPNSYQMPQGSTLPEGTFFGPQLYNPYHLSFGRGLLGQFAGMGIEGFAASHGYAYMPPGVNPFDVMQNRGFERSMRGTMRVGAQFDENRLARALEVGFRNALGMGSGASAYANSLASRFGVLAPSMMRSMAPGGSAQDFAQGMFLTGQAMRDYTVDRYSSGRLSKGAYRLGIPDNESQNMTRRLLEFFAPGGEIDPQMTRGLSFKDLGSLGVQLSGRGLLDSTVTKAMPGQTIDGTRALQMGKQLQQYAEVVGIMRDIMGSPNAPLQQVISGLQSLTGGGLNQLDPASLQNTLLTMKGLARASSISMTGMAEHMAVGVSQFNQMGMHGPLGGAAMQAALVGTVGRHTAVSGPFAGRFSQGELLDYKFGANTRGILSPAATVSIQAQRMLETIDQGGLTAAQKKVFNQIQTRADSLGFNMQNLDELQDMFSELGVGHMRSFQNLTSRSGIDRYVEKNPGIWRQIEKGQIDETAASFGKEFVGLYGALAKSEGEVLDDQIRAAAKASGKSTTEIMTLLGESVVNMDRGTPDEMRAFLQANGVKVSGINFQGLFDTLSSDPGVQRQMQYRLVKAGAAAPGDRGVKTFGQVAQVFSRKGFDAAGKLVAEANIEAAGNKLLSDVGAGFRGTSAFQRFVGAVAGGEDTVKGAMMKGLGFVDTDEITRHISDASVKQLSQDRELLAKTTDPQKRKEIKERMNNTMAAMTKVFDENPGIQRTKGLVTLHDAIEGAALADMGDKITDTMVNDAVANLNENDANQLRSSIAELKLSSMAVRSGGSFFDVEDAKKRALKLISKTRSSVSRSPSMGSSVGAKVGLIRDTYNAISGFTTFGGKKEYADLYNKMRQLGEVGVFIRKDRNDPSSVAVNRDLVDKIIDGMPGLDVEERDELRKTMNKDFDDLLELSQKVGHLAPSELTDEQRSEMQLSMERLNNKSLINYKGIPKRTAAENQAYRDSDLSKKLNLAKQMLLSADFEEDPASVVHRISKYLEDEIGAGWKKSKEQMLGRETGGLIDLLGYMHKDAMGLPGGPERLKKIKEIVTEGEAAIKASEKSETGQEAVDKDKEAQGTKITVRDAKTGEITSELLIQVEGDGSENGNEAVANVIPWLAGHSMRYTA